MVVVARICTWEWAIFSAMIVGGYRDGGLGPRFRGDDGGGGDDGVGAGMTEGAGMTGWARG